jgi:hypothetical protein
MLNSLAFKEYKKNNDIHGTVLYPAVMVAPMQKNILKKIIAANEISSIFDPFHGSGTALYEAMEISPNLHLVGCDINPLANLITKVKLQGINKNVARDIRTLKDYVYTPRQVYKLEFPNMDKWFRSDILDSLEIVRSAIMHIEDDQNRLFFWYTFCDVIRRHSNTRSSTYKLHIKPINTILRIENNVVKDFFSAIIKSIDMFKSKSNNFSLFKCNILDIIGEFDDEAFDISITSPPYGENATTVTYGQFSMLALYIIARNDLELEGWELDNYSKIDSKSLGGKKSDYILNEFEKELLQPYLANIEARKHRKVLRFFADYFRFLHELCRVTHKYIALTLGNRTVDRVQINLTNITKIFLENHGFVNILEEKRDIPNKRIPKITSNVQHRPVASMNCEYIIIHKRVFGENV